MPLGRLLTQTIVQLCQICKLWHSDSVKILCHDELVMPDYDYLYFVRRTDRRTVTFILSGLAYFASIGFNPYYTPILISEKYECKDGGCDGYIQLLLYLAIRLILCAYSVI